MHAPIDRMRNMKRMMKNEKDGDKKGEIS